MSSQDVYKLAADQARANAEAYLSNEYGVSDLRITDFSPGLEEMLWSTEKFSWADIASRDFGPATLRLAVWIGARLEVLAICTGHGPQIIVRHVEGRPDGDPRLKGQRLWIVLEATANFATGLGKREIWWHPETDGFLKFCVETIGVQQRGRECLFQIPA